MSIMLGNLKIGDLRLEDLTIDALRRYAATLDITTQVVPRRRLLRPLTMIVEPARRKRI